jgi:hypothetical protein
MGLNHGDLRMTIDEVVEIDRYKAKMGTDEDVVVVNFTAENKDAGQDLVDFLESGYDWILDSAVSPGTNNRGKYMVFVEVERNVDIKDNIGFMLKEVGKVAEVNNWRFRIGKSTVSREVTEDSLSMIPNSPEAYTRYLADSKQLEAIKYIASY